MFLLYSLFPHTSRHFTNNHLKHSRCDVRGSSVRQVQQLQSKLLEKNNMKPLLQRFVVFLFIGCVLSQGTQEDSSTNSPTTPFSTSSVPPEPSWRSVELGDLIPDVKFSFRSRHVGRKYSISVQPDFLLRDYSYMLSLQLWNKPTGVNDNFTLNVSYESRYSGSWTENIEWTMDSRKNEEISKAKTINISLSENSQLIDDSLDLVATLYFESQNSCPAPFYRCKCKVKEDRFLREPGESFRQLEVIPLNLQLLLWEDDYEKNRRHSSEDDYFSEDATYRCISSDLLHNGRPNCQAGCNSDESNTDHEEDFEFDEGVGWHDVQYLLTIIMAGIFFILCPVCIMVFILYHRRLNAEASRIIVERQRGSRPRTSDVEVGVMASPPDDIPPSYEDVHDIKTPPPSFESVVISHTTRCIEDEASMDPAGPSSSSSSA